MYELEIDAEASEQINWEEVENHFRDCVCHTNDAEIVAPSTDEIHAIGQIFKSQNPRLADLYQQVWQSVAAVQLLIALDERYAALQASARVSFDQRTQALAAFQQADTQLCLARSDFIQAICDLHKDHWSQTGIIDPQEQAYDVLNALWEFEAAWEKAMCEVKTELRPPID